jgi:hypothetical protein
MSMNACFRALSRKTALAILSGALDPAELTVAWTSELAVPTPALVEQLRQAYAAAVSSGHLSREAADAILAQMAAQVARGQQIAEAMRRSDSPITPDDAGEPVAVDKAWHGIMFLLDAVGCPVRLIEGGTPVGEDAGYGPAHLLEPAQVVHIAQALRALTPARIARLYDGPAMEAEGIYPGGWDEPDTDGPAWLEDNVLGLEALFLEAAVAGDWMLCWLH